MTDAERLKELVLLADALARCKAGIEPYEPDPAPDPERKKKK